MPIDQSTLTDESRALRAAVLKCAETFSQAPRRQLSDLSPRFWVALMDLEIAAADSDDNELLAELQKAYHQLGAPGDFGYDTPCGGALRKLYDAWRLSKKTLAAK